MEGMVMTMLNSQFWSKKKVFITGHTGFKGSWITLWLTAMGAKVKGFALEPPTSPCLFDVARVEERCCHHEIGDIRDYDHLLASMKNFNPDIVIHMAAQPLVGYSYAYPVETYHINIMGTVHLLEAIRTIDSVVAVVLVTSDKCYENREWIWGYREVEPMGGHDPYSSSKGCAELIVSAYRNSFFNSDLCPTRDVAIASARAGNVIGGGDWAENRLVPDILRAFELGEKAAIRNPDSIRPWQHVLEPLKGYLLLAEKLYQEGTLYSGGWNFGPHSSDYCSVSFIVDKMVTLWGKEASWYVHDSFSGHEANCLTLDCSKAIRLLNWSPEGDISETLESVVKWHQYWLEGYDMQKYTLREIEMCLEEKDDT